NSTWKSAHPRGYQGEIANVVDNVVLYNLMSLSANDHAAEQVRAIASLKLHELTIYLNSQQTSPSATLDPAHLFFALKQIDFFEKNPKAPAVPAPVEPPDGPPIGGLASLGCDWN